MDTTIVPFDWHRIFIGDAPPLFLLEIVFRVAAIYVFAIAFVHLLGKRAQQQLTPLEYLVIIALGSATGDGMLYPDVPLLWAFVVIAVLLVLTEMMARLKNRFGPIARYIETRPATLVKDGQLQLDAIRAEGLTETEVAAMLRTREVTDVGHVRWAFLEVTGSISVFRYPEGERRPGRLLVPPDDAKYGRVSADDATV